MDSRLGVGLGIRVGARIKLEPARAWEEVELGASPRMAAGVEVGEARAWRRAEAGVLPGVGVPMRKRVGAEFWRSLV